MARGVIRAMSDPGVAIPSGTIGDPGADGGGAGAGGRTVPPGGASTPEGGRRSRRRKKRPRDGAMPLMEHIYEFRRRLLIAFGALVLASILGFVWYQYSVGPIESLGHILTGPYCSLPDSARANLGATDECRLLATGPFEQFMLRLKVSITAGAVLSCPVWLYQLWAFIVPGLHKKERAYGRAFTLLAAVLFVSGAIIAYIVVSHALSFLLTVGNDVQVTALSGSEYFNFLIYLLLIFGVSFEIPLLIAMLNVVGVLSYEQLKKARRGIIVGIFGLAAVISPGSDPFSMLALAVAVCVLVEVSTQFARINDKRRGKRAAEWEDLDDDSASSIGTASGIAPATGIGGGGPLAGGGGVAASPTPGSSPTIPAPAPISASADHTGTAHLGVGGSAPLPPPGGAHAAWHPGTGTAPRTGPTDYDDVL